MITLGADCRGGRTYQERLAPPHLEHTNSRSASYPVPHPSPAHYFTSKLSHLLTFSLAHLLTFIPFPFPSGVYDIHPPGFNPCPSGDSLLGNAAFVGTHDDKALLTTDVYPKDRRVGRTRRRDLEHRSKCLRRQRHE